ncbi:MAG: MotA/TolQ/ExbB proton channel family protein [Lentisphaerae bacterium]|jgi:biopolymer transport protein ExbB|nr:MotA/TolQ/ExbB proton channel family protein [Lentisphaerota bacterium]MBT4816463.1 MotA/TolQ/ExbB proton channel family protein [Lentisphaerota bacterium]MBT5607825.1 MotA/TolQ/ExbB proton channel family protein [Lentisphaerota bacterium]MBT7059095.1 MotA/TolQ/ExbB proton channel family protein [Lentisphaerota bacterium]MBT7847935.1 MotA/TolQ/ExbB proton channel family protein [Lentisphaerota bacterium]
MQRHPLASTAHMLITTVLLFAAMSCLAAEGDNSGFLGKTVWETIQRGGAVMYVILALSVIGLTFIFEAAFRTRRSAILPASAVRALASSDTAAAVERLAGKSQKVSLHRVLKVGHRWRRGSTQQIQSAIEEVVDDMLWQFRRSVRPIGILANTAPLLGLLGTVVGIIEAFDVVAQEGALGDPSALAAGISKALFTTCFGLIVAIPMLLSYHYLAGKAETLLRQCEELAKEALVLPPD